MWSPRRPLLRFGGYVETVPGSTHVNSVARSLALQNHRLFELRFLVVVSSSLFTKLSNQTKVETSLSLLHPLSHSSLRYPSRQQQIQESSWRTQIPWLFRRRLEKRRNGEFALTHDYFWMIVFCIFHSSRLLFVKSIIHYISLCRFPGCTKVIKSQGHCQKHGARAKRCKVPGCEKQAQGTHDGMCKRTFYVITASSSFLSAFALLRFLFLTHFILLFNLFFIYRPLEGHSHARTGRCRSLRIIQT